MGRRINKVCSRFCGNRHTHRQNDYRNPTAHVPYNIGLKWCNNYCVQQEIIEHALRVHFSSSKGGSHWYIQLPRIQVICYYSKIKPIIRNYAKMLWCPNSQNCVGTKLSLTCDLVRGAGAGGSMIWWKCKWGMVKYIWCVLVWFWLLNEYLPSVWLS